MINPIVSAGSNALQALEQLWSSRQSSSGAGAAGVFSAGQSLPTGANSTSSGQAPSSPSSQFDAAALNFLTSLQDAGSSAAQQLNSSGYLSSQGQGLVQQGLGDLSNIVTKLEKALTSAGGSSSTSSATPTTLSSAAAGDLSQLASTASAAASALSSGTPTAGVEALNQLMSTLQALGLSGHHHHHHGGGPQAVSGADGASATSAGSTSSANSGAGATSVASTTGSGGASS